MPSALVITPADPSANPRPNRMIRCLARDFQVSVLASGNVALPGVTCEPIPLWPRGPVHRLTKLLRLAARRYAGLLWSAQRRSIAARHHALDHAFITVHDLWLLPLALEIRNTGRVLFDAREYYPRQFEDIWWWRLLYQPFNRTLCRRYLHQADHVVTVSPGLAAEYRREFGVPCHLLPSFPQPCRLSPQPVDPARIRIVHHGLANPSRRLETMLELMDQLPEHFSLDLMLVPTAPVYLAKLKRLAAARKNVRIVPPVPFANLLEATNAYDIGLFLAPPTTFNLQFTLPNKFFEFVQARLMVAIGPSPDMAHYVREYDLGVVAADFAPQTLATALRRLTPADIMRYKHNSDRAAAVLNSDHTNGLVRALARGETLPPAGGGLVNTAAPEETR